VETKEKPRFLTQLESVEDVPEGTPIRLEATFLPARDNELTLAWEFNGQPLGASQLIRARHDLGWAALDINGVNMDHVGVYTLKIANSEGEAATSASVKVYILVFGICEGIPIFWHFTCTSFSKFIFKKVFIANIKFRYFGNYLKVT
jgi:hypothetical protein